MSDGVMSMVVGSLQRLEDSLGRLSADMRVELAKLPEQYVHRREADRRFDELCLDLAEERASREADIRDANASIKDANASVKDLEKRLVEGRRWFVGLACGTGLSAAGVLIGILNQFS